MDTNYRSQFRYRLPVRRRAGRTGLQSAPGQQRRIHVERTVGLLARQYGVEIRPLCMDLVTSDAADKALCDVSGLEHSNRPVDK